MDQGESIGYVLNGRVSRRAVMLEEVFRGLAYIWFIFGSAVTGALVVLGVFVDVGVWGYVAAAFFAVGGMFWTLFLWAFLLLCSTAAGYLGNRTQHTRMEMME